MLYVVLYFKSSIYLQDNRTSFYFIAFQNDINFPSPYISACYNDNPVMHKHTHTLLEVYQKAVNICIRSDYYTAQLHQFWINGMKFIAHASTWLRGFGML